MPIAALDGGTGGAPAPAVTEAQWSVRRRWDSPAPSWGRWGAIIRFALLMILLLMS